MIVDKRLHFNLRIIALSITWYAISSASSIVNKLTLQSYPYPLTLTLVSLCSIFLYSFPLLQIWENEKQRIPRDYMIRYVLPISVGKALAVAAAQFSIWKVPISYAQTVKATLPLFSIITARLVLKEKQTLRVYLSVLPIVFGVIIASLTEISFNIAGLLSALLSTATYALLNVFVKRVLLGTGVHPLRLLAITSQLALLIFFPIWFFHDALPAWKYFAYSTQKSPDTYFAFYLILSGTLSFCQNLCAFTLIHQLTALSYAVANATKRITVIIASLITLRNPVAVTNLFGMLLAVLGVFLYNHAKQLQKLVHGHGMRKVDSLMSENLLTGLDTCSNNPPTYTTNLFTDKHISTKGADNMERNENDHINHVRFIV